MKTYTFFGLVGLLSLPLLSGRAQEPERQVLYVEDFSSETPAGWELQQGWRLEMDGGNRIMSGADHCSATYMIDSFETSKGGWKDFRMRLRLQLVEQGSRIHINFRLSNKGRYFVGFQTNGLYLSKEAPWDNHGPPLATSDVPHSNNTWHIVDIVAEGSRIEVFVDGKNEIKHNDPQPLLSGTIGLETLEDSVVHVDDILVIGQPRVSTDFPMEGPVNIAIIIYDDNEKVTGISHELKTGLQHGDEIKTPADMTTVITFPDGSKITMMPNTYIIIDSPGIWAKLGQIIASIRSKFEVKTEYVTAKVKGTTFGMIVEEDGQSSIEMIEGRIVLIPNKESQWKDPVNLQSGQQASIGRVEPPQPKPIPADRYRAIIQEINALQTRRATTKEIFVPLVVGLELSEARVSLRAAKLVNVEIRETAQGNGPVGTVVRQDPGWGESVEPDKPMTLWIKIKQ